MDIQENTKRSLFVPQTSRNHGVWVLLDCSVATGDLTLVCQTGPIIAFLVLTAYYLFPSILESIWFCVYHVMNVPPFPFFGFFTFFGGRLGNSPLAHSGVLWVLAMAGHPPQEELLSLCPLTLGWWPYHLPAARGFSSLPLSVGWGGHHLLGSPSSFRSQSRASNGALCVSYACKWLSVKIRKGCCCSLCGELARERAVPLLVASREL